MNEMIKIQHLQWAQDLDDQRRSGLTQKEWCKAHGINFNTFEYRCKVVRKATEHLIAENPAPVQFAELDVQTNVPEIASICVNASDMFVEFFPNADCNQIKTVMEVLCHAKE